MKTQTFLPFREIELVFGWKRTFKANKHFYRERPFSIFIVRLFYFMDANQQQALEIEFFNLSMTIQRRSKLRA